MTKQIEQAYRRNRGRSWLLIAAVVALAAVAIPIASGAPDKNYTLGYAVATQAAPSPPLTRSPICTSTSAQNVELFLTNTAKSVSLGSAEITLPAYATGATAFKKVTPSSAEVAVTGSSLSYNAATDKLRLSNLGLGKYGSVRIEVAVNPTSVGTETITAIVKQSNDFNDSSGSANLFAEPTFPTLTVQNCFGTISGQVWNDQNENKVRDAAFEVAQSTWSVRLYKKVSGAYQSVRTSPNSFDVTGVYTFADVPLGSDYLVCAAKPTGDAKSWHQTTDTNNATDCKTMSASNETNGIEIAPFAASVTGKNFGNAWSTVVATCGGSATSNGEFSVVGGSEAAGNCKNTTVAEAEFVYEKWTEGAVQYAAFHPVDGDGVCDLAQTTARTCTYFVQKMTWDFTASEQPDPGNRSLNYDDKKNKNGAYEYEAMKYCKEDPRAIGSELGLAPLGTPKDVANDVLPDGKRTVDTADGAPLPVEQREPHSSCLIKSTESTTTGGKISRVDLVFTAVDGRSAMG